MTDLVRKMATKVLSESNSAAEYLYGLACEEAGEATQEAAKLLRFGVNYPKDYLPKLKRELDDLTVIRTFIELIQPSDTQEAVSREDRRSWRASRVLMEMILVREGMSMPPPELYQGTAEVFREMVFKASYGIDAVKTVEPKLDNPWKQALFEEVIWHLSGTPS